MFKIVAFLLLINFVLLGVLGFFLNDRSLKVYFFDVGQGDAIYIRTKYAQDIVIDGGPSSDILSKLGKSMPFYDRDIDILILTHPHADHSTGALKILENYNVRQVYLTGAIHSTYVYIEFLKFLQNHKEIKKVKVDHQFKVILGKDLALEFLYPDFDVARVESLADHTFLQDNLNNTSIVVKLTSKDESFLFTGDIESEVEKYLADKARLSSSNILSSKVLKIPHQGSSTSSTDLFLELVRPNTAVITAGADNPFGHPHQEVLDRLTKFNIKILRTDIDYDIIMQKDDE